MDKWRKNLGEKNEKQNRVKGQKRTHEQKQFVSSPGEKRKSKFRISLPRGRLLDLLLVRKDLEMSM